MVIKYKLRNLRKSVNRYLFKKQLIWDRKKHSEKNKLGINDNEKLMVGTQKKSWD